MENYKYETINEAYLGTRLRDILEISTTDVEAVSTFFSGMYNYCAVMPESNIHANDYYLYVKVFNIYFKDNPETETLFSKVIELLLSKNDIVNMYLSFEVLVSQFILTNNRESSFDVSDAKMIDWFDRMFLFFRNTNGLEKIQYGIAKMYPDGLKGVINSYMDVITEKYDIDTTL